MVRLRYHRLLSGCLVWGLALLTASCAINPVSGNPEVMLLSEDKEIELGQQADRQVVREYGIYSHPNLSRYVNRIGQKLSKLSHRPGLSYQFKILDSPVVNAFAVPGGYVYLSRGILAYLNNEAQLAGVMGHEIGHVTARHSAEQYTRSQLAQVGLTLGMILSPTFRTLSDFAQLGTQMLFLKFSRDDEREADHLGVLYSTEAGYDATQVARFFETLARMNKKSEGGGLPGWFSTHPNPTDRQGNVIREAKQLQISLRLEKPRVGRKAYLRQIDGLVFGEDPRQGYVEDHMFYHPSLRFQFPVPRKWKLRNLPNLIQMASPEKDATILFSLATARSPQEASRLFIRKNGVSVLFSSKSRTGGFLSEWLLWEVRSPQARFRGLSRFVQKNGKVFAFHGITAPSRLERYRPVFEDTMSRFKELTNPTKLKVEPKRIRIRRVLEPGSLRQALISLGISRKRLQDTALLNGLRLGQPVPRNMVIKTIEGGKS